MELIGHVQQALDLQVYNSRKSSALETFCESAIHSLFERSLKKTRLLLQEQGGPYKS